MSKWLDDRALKASRVDYGSVRAIKEYDGELEFGLLQINPKFPDFRHKQTGEALWLADARKPYGVQAQLVAVTPGTLQSNVFTWAQRLKSYVKAKHYNKTLEVFRHMKQEGICPGVSTFLPVLKACAGLEALEEGKCVHTEITQAGCDSDIYVATCLVDMYAKCGGIQEAWSVFNKMQERDVVSWNSMIGGYVKSGQGLKAMELFLKMQQERVEPNPVTFVRVLNACASVAALKEGKHVHKQIIERGYENNIYVANCLVDMYAKCGSIADAWIVFNKMREHSVVSWSAIISGCVKCGQGLKAMELFREMQQEGVEPNPVTFVGVLNACASVAALEEGRSVHEQIIQRGYECNVYVANCLVDMYAKCGSMEDAWSLFTKMRRHDVISWSAMIGGYAKSGQGLKAVELFQEMQREGVGPNAITFVAVLYACGNVVALEEGRRVHKQIIQRGCRSDVHVANCLVDMYAKCGSMEDALSVFNKMQKRDVVSWSAMIGGYVKSGQGLKAVEVYRDMQQEGVEPDIVTFVRVLKACASLAALEEGRCVHELITRRGCESDDYVATCLVDMYAKCGSIEDAWSVFNKMLKRDVVSWSAMIAGLTKSGQGLKAMEFFRKMQQEGVKPNAVTFVAVLNACISVADLEEGRRVHQQIIRADCESDCSVATCLIDMYAKCGSIEDAGSVFNKMREHDVVSFNAMIAGYVKCGQALKAMELFQNMQLKGLEPSPVTFVGVLKACTNVEALEEGKRVHQQIIQRGYESDDYVATCLVDMYAKCGSIEDAWSAFSELRDHDVVSWGAMIASYVKFGQGLKAMELFQRMQQEGVEPTTVTFVGVLNACASIVALEEGRRVHEQIMRKGYEWDIRVATSLVDMYAKCGRLEEAWCVFKKMREHDVASWNAIIVGYVKSGQGLKAIELFQQMQHEGVDPNIVTFVGVLNACASALALEEGRLVHEQIILRGCEFDVYVANCLVDMYGKCGSIEDARSVFNKMLEKDVVSWSTMIAGYVKSGQGLEAIKLFRKMQEEGVEPDAITFVGVLSACASIAAVEEGRLVHEQVILRAFESDDYVATCLVDMYAKCGSIEDAWSVFKKMWKLDVASWNAMIGGYAMHGYAKDAIGLFKRMGKSGVEINEITFTCLLSACSHGGLLKEGLRYFGFMTSCYDILPTIEHYVTMVDLLGRAGRLEEAEDMTIAMAMERNISVWLSLLGACRIHGNVRMAERAAKWCWQLDPENASGHVLLSNIYAAC